MPELDPAWRFEPRRSLIRAQNIYRKMQALHVYMLANAQTESVGMAFGFFVEMMKLTIERLEIIVREGK